jgi:proteic killer suppression protein
LDNDLDRLETDAGFDGGFPQAVVSAFRKRMQMIRAATDERAFYALKSLHFEKLKGARTTDHSMRLNDQWRLIIRFEQDDEAKTVLIVKIEDYH